MSNPTRTVFECDMDFLPILEEWKRLATFNGFSFRERLQPYIIKDLDKLRELTKENKDLKRGNN